MVLLKELVDAKFEERPRNGGYRNKYGFMNIYKTKCSRYKNSCWRFQRIRNGKATGCTSSSLLGLKEKCAERGIPWFLADETKARETCRDEGVDFNVLMGIGEVIRV